MLLRPADVETVDRLHEIAFGRILGAGLLRALRAV